MAHPFGQPGSAVLAVPAPGACPALAHCWRQSGEQNYPSALCSAVAKGLLFYQHFWQIQNTAPRGLLWRMLTASQQNVNCIPARCSTPSTQGQLPRAVTEQFWQHENPQGSSWAGLQLGSDRSLDPNPVQVVPLLAWVLLWHPVCHKAPFVSSGK